MEELIYKSRRLVKPGDLNHRGTLFGGKLLEFIDEEAAIFAICQLETDSIVTKLISEINFISPAKNGDVIEFGMKRLSFGRTSLAFECVVRNKATQEIIVKIDKIVL